MSEIKYQPRETHESKQRGKLIALFYTMISFGIGIYIEEADVLFGPYVKDMLTDSDNKYSPNMAAIVNSLIVGAALFPIFWVVKKVIGKTHQNEFTATESGNKKEFSFTLTHTVNTVILDDMFMNVKTGFLKRTILFSGLRNYYLMHSKMFSTMLFTYEDNNGKFKRWSMSGQPHNEQVQLLNAELEKRFPGKSLNNLSQKEAFKIMKKMNRILLAATLVPIIFLIAVGIIALIIMFS